MSSNTNGIGTTSSMRGVNFGVNASGNNGTIEYYLNDAPIGSAALFNAICDIGRIEALRGPQGTLRGRASPSGSITIAHHKPDLDEFGGYALGTVNDIGGANINGALNVPGVLAVRVAGLAEGGQATRVRSINNPGLDSYNRNKSGRMFLRFEPADFFNAEAVYQRIELKSRLVDQIASFSEFLPGAAASPILIRPKDRLGIKREAQTSRSTFDIFTWKASAGFAGQRLYYVGSDLHQRINAYVPQDEANAFPALNFGQFNSNNTRVRNHEIRLQNEQRIAGLFDYVCGYFRSKLKAPTALITPRFAGSVTAPTVIYPAALRGTRTGEESYFGNLSLHLGDATELSGGARRIRIKQRSSLGSVTIPAASSRRRRSPRTWPASSAAAR